MGSGGAGRLGRKGDFGEGAEGMPEGRYGTRLGGTAEEGLPREL